MSAALRLVVLASLLAVVVGLLAGCNVTKQYCEGVDSFGKQTVADWKAMPDVLDATYEYRHGLDQGQVMYLDVTIRGDVDKDKVIETALNGFGTPATSYLDEGNAAYQEAATVYDHDVEKAKQLLADAGATDLSFELTTTDASFIKDIAPLLVEAWKKIGVEATLNTVPSSAVYGELVPSDSFRVLLASGDQLPFPDRSFDLVLTSAVILHNPPEVAERIRREVVRVARRWAAHNEDVNVSYNRYGYDTAAWYASRGIALVEVAEIPVADGEPPTQFCVATP